MFFIELFKYWFFFGFLMIGKCFYPIFCTTFNSFNQPDIKPAETIDKQKSTKLILTDDDGDAVTRFEFYYDEKLWEEERADKR